MRSSRHIANVENRKNAAVTGRSRLQFTYFKYLIITTVAEVSESNPESVTASAYDGIRNGRAVIMNMPKPKPTVRCTKLAPMASRNMAMLNSIINESGANIVKNAPDTLKFRVIRSIYCEGDYIIGIIRL